MTVPTLFKFLIGSRSAIESAWFDRRSVWIGLVLVLSAALAREYDGAYLAEDFVVLLIPLGVSFAAAGLFFFGIAIACRAKRVECFWWRDFPRYLGVFWLTAPLAWFYAVPFERFLDPVAATKANLWTLGLVAAWRVLLMSRVVSVVAGFAFFPAFLLIMLIADLVAAAAILIYPAPILQLMSGTQRMYEHERIVLELAANVGFAAFISIPAWAIAAPLVLHLNKPKAALGAGVADRGAGRLPMGVRLLLITSIGGWFFPLLFTQREQRLRHEFESEMEQGQISKALAMLSAHPRRDFPPMWLPPPRAMDNRSLETLIPIMHASCSSPIPGWARAHYLKGLEANMTSGSRLVEPQLASVLLDVVACLPEGPELVARADKFFKGLLKWTALTQEQRKAIQEVIAHQETEANTLVVP